MTRRIEALVALIVVVALVGCDWLKWPVSRKDFLASQKREGWVQIGEFGKVWPAVLVREERGEDAINFKLSSGQVHRYSGFDGFSLKVVFLKAVDGTETVVVLRSEKRRGE